MNSHFASAHTPFYINTKEGRYLVLKAVKVCDVRTVECEGSKASCVLKVDKPSSPSCERRPSSPSKCERMNNPGKQVPFMRTDMLQNMFAANRDNVASRLLS
ncbi:CPXV066 protein [Camelpox virus]|uniref:Core phosphoprotein F17 n=1 Tax=Camelpox virus TaxID=28873 RepID=A0A4Y5N176_9POXV|nr:core phosphoprotein F17 [Camelpox virus]UEC93129.1 CPXV066 protein [Camelpox virus]UEC93357.1 CPXV066 protein [Camelpox virus]UEC93586.1 CPXV066 protein [Camelpox virus]UEC93815.1 CPXV066 protein [Camelpox virus]